MRGEPRDVRSRRPRCWFLPFARVCPAAMPPIAPSLRRVNVHGSLDRAKDASRDEGNDLSCLRPVLTLGEREPTAFPSSATRGHPRSSARSFAAEEPRRSNDEPTKAFVPMTPREERRLPEDRDAFDHHDTRRK